MSAKFVLTFLTRFRANSCAECSQPLHWWNRRRLANGEDWMHLQCWEGRLFLRSYVQSVAEEIRSSSGPHTQPSDNSSPDTGDSPSPDAELRELRASARALRQRVERMEAQLLQAEELVAKTRGGPPRASVKQATSLRATGLSRPGSGSVRGKS
jgi:hypothetical protein